MTAGPAMGTASPRTTKTPVPRVAPIPIIDSCQNPMVRRRPLSLSVSATSFSTGLRLLRRRPSVGATVSPLTGVFWSTTNRLLDVLRVDTEGITPHQTNGIPNVPQATLMLLPE